MKPRPQMPTTRKFKKATDPGYKGMVAVKAFNGRTEQNPIEERPVMTLYGGRNGYLWVGSDERGCYATLPLSVLKRLIKSAEAR